MNGNQDCYRNKKLKKHKPITKILKICHEQIGGGRDPNPNHNDHLKANMAALNANVMYANI
jgi:hypothetical protein